MAIFSRREIQRCIDENARFLLRRQTNDHIRRLNRCDEYFLDAEWEVVLINAFSKLGTITHETKIEGTSKPDILFVAHVDPNQTFLADIATVSDRGLEEHNPIRALRNDLLKLTIARGLPLNSFNISVEGTDGPRHRGSPPTRLKLPPRRRFDELIFNAEFDDFLDKVGRAPSEARTYRVNTNGIAVCIGYIPTQRGSMTAHSAYDHIRSLVQNTIYNVLERKAGQLTSAGYDGPLGIMLCDGGSSLFRRTRTWESYSAKDVILYFLEQHPAISFVMTFAVEQSAGYDMPEKAIVEYYEANPLRSLGDALMESFGSLGKVMPVPNRTASNAVYLLEGARKHEGSSHYGGLTVGDREIQISARAVLDLLAGKITQERFLEVHKFDGMRDHAATINPFARMRKEGRMISEVTVEMDGEDDDWLTVKFGDPDPAISQFRAPDESRKDE